MTRKFVRIIFLSAILFLSFFKTAQGFAYSHKKSGLFFGVSGSWDWMSNAGTAKVPNGSSASPPSDVDFYTISKPKSQGNFAFYAGYRFVRLKRFFPSISLAFRYSHLLHASVNGTVEQYSLPAFLNYNYTLNFNSDIYTLQAMLELFRLGLLAPYVSAGIGFANNNIYNYNETAVSGVTPRVSPDFGTNNNFSFVYNIGAGVNFRITKKLIAALGYEHANLGKINGVGNGSDWTNQSLSLGTLKTNAVMLGFFYQIT